ncbi:MAG: AMP-binding protein [Pseudomonadota bacterium]
MREPGRSLVPDSGGWNDLRAQFRWPRWSRFNIAEACCDVWARADPDRIALRYIRPDGEERIFSYRVLERASRRFANALRFHGVERGDRVAVLLPQSPETLIAHLAAYRLGAIVVPLFSLFGEDGLHFRMRDSGARAIITDAQNLPKVVAIRDALPDLRCVFSIDVREKQVLGFWQELGKAADACPTVPTASEDPAFLSYTSGTTGPPKGALHAHRCLIGHLPGISLAHNGLGQKGDCIWTPADWAWMGGLTNVLLPSLYHGVPVVAHRMTKYDPEGAADLIIRTGIRNTFFPPTALKLMRQAGVERVAGLRSVTSAGEALGSELLDWGQGVFGLTINEFYGQTECNPVIGNCSARMPVKPGSTGKPIPGHDVAIVSPNGDVLPPGEPGEIAVRRPDPAMFLRYWNNPVRTAEKIRGEWLPTGDEAVMDEEGYVFFQARSDDVITSSGYRIGPTEIEECLSSHPDVIMAGVVGVPDPIRTEAVKAFVILRDNVSPEGLELALKARVRDRISPHVAPRNVVFVNHLPMTATGKIQRRFLREA